MSTFVTCSSFPAHQGASTSCMGSSVLKDIRAVIGRPFAEHLILLLELFPHMLPDILQDARQDLYVTASRLTLPLSQSHPELKDGARIHPFMSGTMLLTPRIR